MGKRNRGRRRRQGDGSNQVSTINGVKVDGSIGASLATQEPSVASGKSAADSSVADVSESNWLRWAYKPQRGRIVRWASAGVVYGLCLFGFYSMYIELNAVGVVPDSYFGWWVYSYASFNIPVYDEFVEITNGLLLSLLLVGAAAYLVLYLFFRHPRIGEFMIETETEMVKVSWPSKQELRGSTIAVVIAVILLGLYLLLIDFVLNNVIYFFIYFEN